MAVEKIAEAACEKRNELRHLFARHTTESFAYARQLQPAAQASRRRIGRRFQKKWLQITREFFQLLIDAKKSLGVASRNFAKAGERAISVGPPREHFVVCGEGNEQAGIARNHS